MKILQNWLSMKESNVIGGVIDSTCYACEYSDNDEYFATFHKDSPFVHIYKNNGESFTKLPNIEPPSDNANAYLSASCSFSKNGDYLAITMYVSPYLVIYKRNGDTFSKINLESSLIPGIAYGCDFSNSGDYLAIAHNSSPYVTILKRNGDEFTKLATPSVVPTSYSFNCVFSHDDEFLALGHYSLPCLTIYKRNGDTFTSVNIDALSSVTSSSPKGMTFSYDNKYLFIGHSFSPYLSIYSNNNGTFKKIDTSTLVKNAPATNIQWCDISPDDNMLAISTISNTPPLLYKKQGDIYEKFDYDFSSVESSKACAFGNKFAHFSSVGNFSDTKKSVVMYKADSVIVPNSLGSNATLSDVSIHNEQLSKVLAFERECLSNNLIAKGVEVSETDKMSTLIDKVGTIATGKKWASGTTSSANSNATFYSIGGGTVLNTYIEIVGLDFAPSIVLIKNPSLSSYFSIILNSSVNGYAKPIHHRSGGLTTAISSTSSSYTVDLTKAPAKFEQGHIITPVNGSGSANQGIAYDWIAFE